MTVSNYLEAFLSVYGWAVYYTFFLLIGVTGLFLYPLLRSLLTILTEYLSGEGYDGIGYLKQAFVILALNMLVFFLALVPVVRISFDKTAVSNICGETSVGVEEMNRANASNGTKYFTKSDARVPMLPWLAMLLGQGFNSVVYKQLPCVMHTKDANKVALSLQTNNEKLDTELDAFIDQCHRKAVKYIEAIRDGRYDQKQGNNTNVQEWFNKELLKKADEYLGKNKDSLGFEKDRTELSKEDEQRLIYSANSRFIYEYFYSEFSPMTNDPSVNEILGGIPKSMKASSTVEGFSGSNNDRMPRCANWWKYGEGDLKKGLQYRLMNSLDNDALLKLSSTSGIPECRRDWDYSDKSVARLKINNPEACLSKFKEKLASPTDRSNGKTIDDINDTLLASHQGEKVHKAEDVMSAGEVGKSFLMAAGSAIAGWFAKKFGVDLSGGLLGTVTSFYAAIFMLKVMLKFLIPMVLMTIYMFWGIYMLIGELRGSTLVKGMIIIFSITSIFGLWEIADHIDDKLWDAMYGGWFGDNYNYISMIVLDATSGIFHIGIASIVFYIVNLAGGGDAGAAIGGGQKQAAGLSGGLGKSISSRSGGFGNWLFSGGKNAKGDYTGGWGRKWIGQGWGKVKDLSGRIKSSIATRWKSLRK